MEFQYVGHGTISVSSKTKVEFCPNTYPVQVFEVVEQTIQSIPAEQTWYEMKSRFKDLIASVSSLLLFPTHRSVLINDYSLNTSNPQIGRAA